MPYRGDLMTFLRTLIAIIRFGTEANPGYQTATKRATDQPRCTRSSSARTAITLGS